MTEELRLQSNRIFPGVSPEAWRRFAGACTYRWNHGPGSRYEAPYSWAGASYYVPYRLGYNDGEGCEVENRAGQAMAWCLASRHHDGHERERALHSLLGCETYPFVVPYLLRPLSEYVFSIYELLNHQRDSFSVSALCAFRDENPAFMGLTWQRIHSYWDAYHKRRIADFAAMPNVRFMKWLESLEPA